jgi:hypothetical protein
MFQSSEGIPRMRDHACTNFLFFLRKTKIRGLPWEQPSPSTQKRLKWGSQIVASRVVQGDARGHSGGWHHSALFTETYLALMVGWKGSTLCAALYHFVLPLKLLLKFQLRTLLGNATPAVYYNHSLLYLRSRKECYPPVWKKWSTFGSPFLNFPSSTGATWCSKWCRG